MKKQQYIARAALYLCQSLLVASLVSLVSCRKPKIEEETGPREYVLHTEETEGKVVVSEKYVPVDWDKSTNKVLKADAEKGEFTMKLEKDASNDIKKGSLMTIDVDSTIYLVKVKDYTIKGENVELETEQASFAEVFAGSSFELCVGDCDIKEMDRATDAYVEPDRAENYEDYDFGYGNSTRATRSVSDGRHMMSDNGERLAHSKLKIYPSEIRVRDEEGNIIKIPYEPSTRLDFPPLSFKWKKEIDLDKDGEKAQGFSYAAGIKFEADITVQVGASLFVDIPEEAASDSDTSSDEDVELAGTTIFQPTVSIDPSFSATVSIYSTITKAIQKKEVGLGDIKVGTIKFMAGLVPVIISINLSNYVLIEPKVSGGLNVSWGFKGAANEKYYAGMKIRNGSPHLISGGGPYNVVTTWPVAHLGVGAEAKVTPRMSFNMLLYNLAGPKIDFGPYFNNHIGAGVGVIANFEDAPEDMITWDAGIEMGAEVVAGIRLGNGKVRKLLQKIVKEDVELDPWKLRLTKVGNGELQLVTAPVGVSCSNAKSIKYGQENKVDFDVTWQWLGQTAKLDVPTFVYFETDAESGELYNLEDANGDNMMYKKAIGVYSSGGKASVGWFPHEPGSMLTAIVYDSQGKIRATHAIKSDTSPNDVKAVDLGCSVLWANMNVGASREGDPGDLVGWGDKTGQNTQQWVNEDYGTYVEDIPTSLGKYGGAEFDRSGIAHSRHDYATAQWGGQWRMPTKKHWEELIKKCTWEWDESRQAYKVSGNGNYIYLPAAGYRIGNRKFNQGQSTGEGDEHPSCEYWSSSCDLKTKEELRASYDWMDKDRTHVYPNAYYMYFDPKGKQKKAATGSTAKCYGQSVRPVFPNPGFGE